MSPRPPVQPERESFDGDELDAYDWVVKRERDRGQAGPDGKLSAYFGALLQSPEMAFHVASLGRWVRVAGEREDSFSHREREWVDQVLAVELGSNVVMRGHLHDALAHGVRAEAVKALREGRDEDLTDDERFLTSYVRAVHRGAVTDELYQAMVDRLGSRGTVDFTVWILFLHLTMRAIEAFTGSSGPTDEQVMDELDGYIAGTRMYPQAPMVQPS